MRIILKFSKNTQPVPIHNQQQVNSYVHKCLGANNKYHDNVSDYSISGLQGGKLNEDKKTLSFDSGGYLIVTGNPEFINEILSGAASNSTFVCGMKLNGFSFINEKFHDGWNYFRTASPILLPDQVTIRDKDYQAKLKAYLIKKITAIDNTLDLSNFDIKIDDKPNNKVKGILIHNHMNLASQCPIAIYTNKRVAELLYTIGVGKSCGSGFGCIYKQENREKYESGFKNS